MNENGRVVVAELPPDTHDIVEAKLKKYSQNAHAKRYRESGTIDPSLLIVDGEPPGALLNSAYRIIQTVPEGHAFTDSAEVQFNVVSTASHRKTGFLGGFKKPHRLDLSGREFIDMISG